MPASSSQHHILWGPGAVVLDPRTLPPPRVDVVNAGGGDVVLLEVVGFELTWIDGTFVILFPLPVFPPLQIPILTLETLGPPFPSGEALDMMVLKRGDRLRGVDVR